MSISDAAYRIAHGYPGGIPAMAARMRMSKHVLQNKVNPNCETHHLHAEELAEMADLANSDEAAQAFCARRNMLGVHVSSFEGVSDAALLDLFLSLEKEKGEWAVSVQKALADGVIDPPEFKRIEREFREYCVAGAEVMSRLQSLVQERRRTPRA
ncbi:Phage regulatory protein CII (CP76) [Nitrosospira sp. Nsp11]|uniref:phage regulatory CII family protein n=1 Tax=Nitrosospira sp. Nsp11 TaxID=1855338 RepID=UPI0009243B97|nr:phage regulatory CII family protein [Nitrosospira sp. Nsp11]SHL10947.1 Phage regulatory protein CII (CP76) [Nitrosospira sp. Nsp11]